LQTILKTDQMSRKYFRTALLSIVYISSFLFTSCVTKNNQNEIDDQLIQGFLTQNKLTAQKHISGLYYIISSVGSGASPNTTSTVEVKYKGSLINGTIFDQTAADKTFTYALSGLIEGWQIGIPLMRKGGKATFFIPSTLGYGASDLGIIPPNSVLIFDIELIDFK
jgi:FKBP-type peptidyl-prolyl cis-trans isomerase FkpA